VFLDLDPALALHLAMALQLHAKSCRNNGLPFPSELQHLAEACWARAKGDSNRQGPTSLAEVVEQVQGAPVALLMDTSEAAEVLAVSQRQVERLVASGELPSVRVGGARRIRRADLEAYVAQLAPSPFTTRIQTKTPSSAA
jgi:excisionase family DNA binding protein